MRQGLAKRRQGWVKMGQGWALMGQCWAQMRKGGIYGAELGRDEVGFSIDGAVWAKMGRV